MEMKRAHEEEMQRGHVVLNRSWADLRSWLAVIRPERRVRQNLGERFGDLPLAENFIASRSPKITVHESR